MKNKLNEKIKKIILTIIVIILIIILGILSEQFVQKQIAKKSFENKVLDFANKNQTTIFSIDKIVLFSSCDSKNKTSSQTNFTIENLYAYTDIAIFINNNSDEHTLENTLKSLKISNIKITQNQNIGQPNLYYKSINDFAKSNWTEDQTDLSKPTLYNNCANPITLSYINQNIKTDYTILDTTNPITYNGTLLKRCGVTLSSIKSSISFEISIENNKNEKFRTQVYIDIPYEDGEKTIYDGSLTLNKKTNFRFHRYD